MKSGFVTLYGKPNVGKSTLINKLMGQKIVIVSDKPQTTWHRINCVYNDEDSQIVFTDTPGVHKPVSPVNRYMLRAITDSLIGMDLILWIFDLETGITRKDDLAFDKIKDVKTPVMAVFNKSDLVPEEKVKDRVARIKSKYNLKAGHVISAVNDTDFQELLSDIKSYIPQGQPFYSPEMLTDRSTKFIISEIIREKVFRKTYEEIPYTTAVYVEHLSEKADGKLHIRAEIWVERPSQKGMIIGKQAGLIKAIRKNAKRDLKYLFDRSVELEVYVKVKKEWRKKEQLLSEDLYFDNK